MNVNYQKELDRIISDMPAGASLLLHSCCAPCSSYVIKYLSDYFNITVFYYNPNITEQQEYLLRAREQKRLISEMDTKYRVNFLEGPWEPNVFFRCVAGHENDREGGERCKICYKMRIDETARLAKEKSFDFFCTTLTISPLKSSAVINDIGLKCASEHGVRWLPSDFKKRDGFKSSIELSKKYKLYRQNYCGCVFSRNK